MTNNNSSNKEQLEAFFSSKREDLLTFITLRINSSVEAEDILHDVISNTISAANTINYPIENVQSWVYTAIRNKIIDFYRKKKTDTFSDIIGTNGDSLFFDSIFFSTQVDDPETELLKKTIAEVIQEALNTLPYKQRMVFEKTELEGLSYKQISEETGINVNTLLARKHYAITHLRKYLQEFYNSLNN